LGIGVKFRLLSRFEMQFIIIYLNNYLIDWGIENIVGIIRGLITGYIIWSERENLRVIWGQVIKKAF
jgi:hypothetical protein